MIRILAIGKRHESWIQDGLERYEKRLRAPWNAEWVLLPHSAREDTQARNEESQAILSRIQDVDYVILLDETGKTLSSPALSAHLRTQIDSSRRIVVVIGGAYGVNDSLISRANFVWSLSPLVFPHQLVRLILIEQLYRAQEIFLGNPYHHE